MWKLVIFKKVSRRNTEELEGAVARVSVRQSGWPLLQVETRSCNPHADLVDPYAASWSPDVVGEEPEPGLGYVLLTLDFTNPLLRRLSSLRGQPMKSRGRLPFGKWCKVIG